MVVRVKRLELCTKQLVYLTTSKLWAMQHPILTLVLTRTASHTHTRHDPATEAQAEKMGWEHVFRQSLSQLGGGPWDYALLDNNSEAEMEAGSFFSLKKTATSRMVGLGIGSSSTQVAL
jgi:hypothetical protein